MDRKGQASIEYLLLFAVSLVIVLIVINALMGLSGAVEKYNGRQHSLLAKDALLSAARDACYIGEGTSFAVELNDKVNVTEKEINGIPYELPCGIEKGNYEGNVLVKNEGNSITVSSVK